MIGPFEVDPTLTILVLTIGAPILVILYFLEGLLLGKLLHPSILFIVYVVVTEPSMLVILVVASVCVAAATAGQLVLYRGFNEEVRETRQSTRIGRYLDRIPTKVRRKIGTKRMNFINRQFDRFGGKAICISNATPGLRGLMTVVAGLSRYPQRQFVLLSTIGNVIYMILLVAVATGILSALQFVPEF